MDECEQVAQLMYDAMKLRFGESLPAESQTLVREHLNRCGSCRALVEDDVMLLVG